MRTEEDALQENVARAKDEFNNVVCQKRIDELNEQITKKKAQIAALMEKTLEFRSKKDDLKHNISLATKDKLGLEEDYGRKINYIQKLEKRQKLLDKQIHDTQEQHIRNTQVFSRFCSNNSSSNEEW